MTKSEVLSVAEMYEVDSLANASGISESTLMENAGYGIVQEIQKRWSPCKVIILCGPGNNGGDGFVVARLLEEAGWVVKIILFADPFSLKGANALAKNKYNGAVERYSSQVTMDSELVVDCLFGAGLNRDLSGDMRSVVDAVNSSGIPCIAVDLPSGIHGDSGRILGTAIKASVCVTFFRYKRGHLLMPGCLLAGEIVVIDIGIPESILDSLSNSLSVNQPSIWLSNYPWPNPRDHKYKRGHALVMGGGIKSSGAACLAAQAALRIGAGLVTVTVPAKALAVYAVKLTAIMTAPIEDLREQLCDERKNAVLLGPGFGIGKKTREYVEQVLSSNRPVILDADALTSFENMSKHLFSRLHSSCILTPHEGEFKKLFAPHKNDESYNKDDKIMRVQSAAKRSGAVVVLKGYDTVIASPNGDTVINQNAHASLATAGSGDVLAGFILGLLSQGMSPFAAACAGVWLHGAVASRFGIGLIAEDIPDLVFQELQDLHKISDW